MQLSELMSSVSFSQIEEYFKNPRHAVLLTAPKGYDMHGVVKKLTELFPGYAKERLLEVLPNEKGSIGIDEVRTIKKSVELKSYSPQDHVYVVIYNVSSMTDEAQNALLKALEEPNINVHFILTTTSTGGIFDTILSRVELIHVSKPSKQMIVHSLKSLGYAETSIEEAYRFADGIPDTMLGILDQPEKNAYSVTAATCKQFLVSSPYERLRIIESYTSDRLLLISFLDTLLTLIKASILSLPQHSPKKEAWRRRCSEILELKDMLHSNISVKLAATALAINL